MGLAQIAAEGMYHLYELAYAQGEKDLNSMMRRLRDLSAYSLTHAEILEQREGVELLALAMFFGATSDPAFHPNQKRLQSLHNEVLVYKGDAERVAKQVAIRKIHHAKPQKKNSQILGNCDYSNLVNHPLGFLYTALAS